MGDGAGPASILSPPTASFAVPSGASSALLCHAGEPPRPLQPGSPRSRPPALVQPFFTSSLPLSPKSPSETGGKPSGQRFSPYVLPSPRPLSTASDGEGRSPSPRSSPPATAPTSRPPFPLFR